MNDPIDVVIPWVDGSDPEWQKNKQYYEKLQNQVDESDTNYRFESWDNLNYLFRAIEKFMPWVNSIFLITCGQIPSFLKRDHPKLNIVFHKDYIPEEYLPTYNSNTIEMNLFRINKLSENFILFNDDLFPLQHIDEDYYFQNNVPCDEAIEAIIMPNVSSSAIGRYYLINDMRIINRHFHKREVQSKNYNKWFTDVYGELLQRNIWMKPWYDFAGFRNAHMAAPYKKSTMKKIWHLEYETLDRASRNHFRNYNDITHFVVRYWQLCEGNFIPRRTLGKSFTVTMNNYEEVASVIEKQSEFMISTNEICTTNDFSVIKDRINDAFEKILPDKCSFEK
jgi:hypothetical protein